MSYYSYVKTYTSGTLTVRRALFNISVAEVFVRFMPNDFTVGRVVKLELEGRGLSSLVINPLC